MAARCNIDGWLPPQQAKLKLAKGEAMSAIRLYWGQDIDV